MDRSLISQAIKAVDLLDIYLHSSSVERDDDITDDHYPDDMIQQNRLNISADFYEPEDESVKCKRLIHAKVTLGVRFGVKVDGEVQVLSEVKACFIAKYAQTLEVSEDAISEFMKYNVIHNVWPFWREHAFTTAAEARLPRPMISLFKDQPMPEDGE